MQGFNKLTLYTNLSLLKKYIAHDMIVAPMVLGEYSYSLSDTGTADMLLFGKCANAGFIKDKYRADNAETPVAITLYLSDTAEVIALDDRGGRHPGRLADLSEYNFFLVHKPISFHNVISVTAVSGELIFLQGDSTVRVPEEIIDRGTYMPAETIDGGVIESILAAVGCERDAEGSQGDISDDEDVSLSELYSRLPGQEEEEDIVKFRRADKVDRFPSQRLDDSVHNSVTIGKHLKNNTDHHYRRNKIGSEGDRLKKLFHFSIPDLIEGQRQEKEHGCSRSDGNNWEMPFSGGSPSGRGLSSRSLFGGSHPSRHLRL